ncbi:hypothetical protein [Paraprevotella clara]|uniref:hypothetical protein n=2 Tax=Paraprevotella clara TaxID=454154 RepID=UPI0026763FFB|nr:hypothetical protein [Paraprevotella clara]
MKLRHLLSASLLCWAGMAGARDVHGVNGYYNWTTAQMQTSANLAFGSEGYKFANWKPRYVFDGDYLKFYLGVNADDRDPAKGGFTNRARLDFREKVAGEGFMVMQPANPVFAVKLSAPKQIENKEGDNATMWIEFYWHNPYNGKQDEPMAHDGGGGLWGLKPKSFDLFTAVCPWKKDEFGRDSVALKYVSKTDKTVAILNNSEKQAQKSDTTMYMKRIPVAYTEDRSDVVLAFNFAAIKDSAQDLRLESMRLLDRVPIKISKFLVCSIVRADTLKVEYDGEGNVVSSTVKTLDEMPYIDIKWIKTFHSMTEFEKSLTAENNWGDGPVENPQKGVLNTTLYEAETVIKGFENYMGAADEAYAALKVAHEEGDAIYNKTDATTEEYLTAIENINAAVEKFYSYLNPNEDLVYNYIRTSDGQMSLYALAEEVTKDSYTGRPLALGANASAIPLTFVPVGEANGQRVYNLKGKEGVVVQCADGTLLLVSGASDDAASFTFADRDGYELFDMKCGSFYYYKDGYELKTVNAFPIVSYEEMQPYLFQIEDALGSYNPTEDEKSGLFEAWEFNGEAEEDPSTKGVVNGVEMTMDEHGQTFMLDGWRMQRWRMWSRVNKGTYKSEDGEDLGCLKLTAAETYDSFDGTSKGEQTVYPASPSMRREGGVFTNFYDRDPAGGQRDESCLINFNPGVRRYLAIKCKGTNPDITVDKMNFLQKSGSAATDFALNLADAEAKGDVYYWDLLKYISVGKMPYVSQYFSTAGFQKDDALYIDWIRTFETEEDIPSESFATAISDVQADGGGLKVFVTGRTINVFTAEAGAIYTVDGMRVASFEGTVHQTVLPGMYIVRAGDTVKKVLVR